MFPRIVTLAAMAALAALTADAAARPARPAPPTEAVAPREAGEPIMAIVSIKTQQVTFYDADGWILRAPVSTGVKERETPAGVFAVVEKDKDHHSSMYDDAWMPNMQRITWNGVALHGGPLPGYAASHGCVRMPYGFAEKLFEKTWIGMRVIISPNDAEPIEFTHPALFVPNREAIAAAPAQAEALAREAVEAAKVADEAKKAAAKAPRETASLTSSLRKLEGLKARADAELATTDKVLAAARTDEAKLRAGEGAQAKAAAKAADLGARARRRQGGRETEARRSRRRKGRRQGGPDEEGRRLPRSLRRKNLALEPVSIFIGRATQKLYVRRNTHKPAPDGGGEVFDFSIEVPVTIRNPDRPIGTPVFTAVARNDAGLRWTAVTIDNGDDAKGALDRITLPLDVLDRIAPTAVPRSSIIVSDEPLSAETNYHTEFVAVLGNQPQGGFITRKPTVNVQVASDAGFGFGSFFQGSWDSQGNRLGDPRDPRRRGGRPISRRRRATISRLDRRVGKGAAAPRRFDRGDVDFLHAHHGVECALCFIAAGRQRLCQHAPRDLPGDAPSVLAPTTALSSPPLPTMAFQ